MGYSRKSGTAALPLPQTSPSPAVSDFSSSFTNVGGAIGETQVVAMGPQIESWLGQAASAYAHESLDIQAQAISLQGILSDISTQVSNYGETYQTLVDTTIPDYQQQWDDAIITHDENVEATEAEMETARQNTPEGETFDDSSFLAEIERQHDLLEETQDDLALYYNQAVTSVDEAAGSTASAIAGLIDGFVPRGENGSLPSRTDISLAMFGGNDGLLGAQSQWESAVEDAPEAVELLNQTDEYGYPTPEALQEFNELYGERLANDPYFAAAFAAELPPQQALELAAKLSSHTVTNMGVEYQDLAENFLTDMGAGMMVATGSRPVGISDDAWNAWQQANGSFEVGEHDDYDAWLGSYLDDMNAAGAMHYTEMGVEEHGRPGFHFLSQYIGAAAEEHESLALSDAFLNGHPDSSGSSVAHNIVTNDYEDSYNYPAINGFGFDGSSDPIINLLSAMDGNPEATRTFLASDTGFDFGNENQNMTSYLVSHRPVPWGENLRWNDGGAQLGLIIDEATSMDDARQNPETFEILDGFLDGYTDGLQANQSGLLQSESVSNWFTNKDENGQDLFGYYNPELRHWAGSILEEYASDLAREVRTPTGTEGASPYTQRSGYDGSDYSLTLSPELRDAITDSENGFFHDLSYDEPAPDDPNWATEAPNSALSKISVAAVEDMRAELTDARIRDYNGEDGQLGRYEDAVGDYGALLSHIELADEAADVSRGQATDQRNSTVRSALDFATDVFPVSRIPGFDDLSDTAQNALKSATNSGQEMGYDEWLSTSNAANAAEDHENETETVSIELSELVRDINIDAQNMTGPQPEHIQESDAQRDPNLQILTEDGYILRWEDMTEDQRTTYRNHAQDFVFGDGEWTGNSVNDIPQIVNEAYDESKRSMP